MTPAQDVHPSAERLRLASQAFAAIVAAIGALVLFGWLADIAILKSIQPQWVSMKANTAFGLVLAGVALLAAQQRQLDRPALRRVALVSAALLGILALATLVEYTFQVDLHIDQLLFTEPHGTIGTFLPGRMAANTAVCLALLALSILTLDRHGTDALHVSEGLSIAVACLAGQNLMGYALDADFNIGAGVYTRMAVHTASGCGLAAAAVLCARPGRGWVGILAGTDNAGRMARRLLPAVISVPIASVFLIVVGVRLGLFDHSYGNALHVVLLVPALCALMVWFSRSLGRRADEVAALAETLAQSQERLLATVTGIGDGVIVTDDDCRVEMMNPVAAQLTGWTVAEALGKPLDEVFHIVSEETRQLTESPAARVLREGCVVGLANHTALIARDGSERPIADSGAPIRGKDGQITGVVLVFRDGTEERRFTAALVESERRYRQLFGEMLDGFALHEMVYDVDGAPVDYRFLAVNRVFERLTGLSEQDIIGKTVRTVIPGIEQEWIERYGAVVRSGLPTHFEMTSATMRRTYDVTAFRPAAGQFACIFNDTTERRELAAKLQVADRLMSVGTLAAGVAHEINNPLAYAAANIDFVAKELSDLLDPNPAAPTASAPSAERAREVLSALADAREGAQRVGRIVRDLKTFSRADDTESAQTDLANVLDLSLRLAGNQIHRRAKVVRAFDALPLVRASESRLGQVFVNLLVNAAQAIGDGDPENNEIRVSTSFVTEGQVAVEVWDSGCGMPPEVIEHIFDPFFTTKPVGEGTGLGLSICHGIVVDLGGQIQVSSTPGRGTVMRVLLPVAQAPDAEPPAQKPEPTAASSRILVIDDQAAVAKALKRLIGGTHDVHVFTDAREALRQIQDGERYDIILSDLMMPAMSGMDLYGELARSHPEQAARMAFITGDAFTPEARAFLEQFPTRHLEKPFDQRAIRELIQAMLQEPI